MDDVWYRHGGPGRPGGWDELPMATPAPGSASQRPFAASTTAPPPWLLLLQRLHGNGHLDGGGHFVVGRSPALVFDSTHAPAAIC